MIFIVIFKSFVFATLAAKSVNRAAERFQALRVQNGLLRVLRGVVPGCR